MDAGKVPATKQGFSDMILERDLDVEKVRGTGGGWTWRGVRLRQRGARRPAPPGDLDEASNGETGQARPVLKVLLVVRPFCLCLGGAILDGVEVYIGKPWVEMDPTFASSVVKGTEFIDQYDSRYFNPAPGFFKTTHTRDGILLFVITWNWRF